MLYLGKIMISQYGICDLLTMYIIIEKLIFNIVGTLKCRDYLIRKSYDFCLLTTIILLDNDSRSYS